MFQYKLFILHERCLTLRLAKILTGDSNGVKEEKEAVGATGEASAADEKSDSKEKLAENLEKAENDPAKPVPEENKELMIPQEEIPAPGLLLITKRSKSSKVELRASPIRS